MRIPYAVAVVLAVALSMRVYAQSRPYVEYCNALRTAYRHAVAGGKPANPAASEASVNCPTNPNGSIPVLEKVLKDMNVELPKRP